MWMCCRDNVGCQRVASALVLQKPALPSNSRDTSPTSLLCAGGTRRGGAILPKAGGGLQCGEDGEGKAGQSWGWAIQGGFAEHQGKEKAPHKGLGFMYQKL